MTFTESRRMDIERRFLALYEATPDERLLLLPNLDSGELEQLSQLKSPVWDGDVISKSLRDKLWDKGLIDRWNGWQFVTIYGFAVLETLRMHEPKKPKRRTQ